MTMNNLHALFEHELKDVYAAEQQVLKMLDQMKNEALDGQLRTAVEEHARETRTQIERIEGVFRSMNLQKGNATCPTVEGLAQEKRHFMQEDPIKEVVEVFNVGAGVKTERYEISAYEGLLDLAEKLGIEDVVAPLQENLREEVQMLERLKGISKSMSIPGEVKGKGQQQTRTTR